MAFRHARNPHDRLAISTTNDDFVIGVDGMGRLGGAAIEQNKTRVAKLLSNGTTRAQAAEFEKKIEAHEWSKELRAKRRYSSALGSSPLLFAAITAWGRAPGTCLCHRASS